MKLILVAAFTAAICYLTLVDQAEAQNATTVGPPPGPRPSGPPPSGRPPRGSKSKGKGGKKPRQRRSPVHIPSDNENAGSDTNIESLSLDRSLQATRKMKGPADQIQQAANEIMNKTMDIIQKGTKKVSGSVSIKGPNGKASASASTGLGR